MSGTNSTATTQSGVPISSLPAAKDVAANDGVFGVFGGEAKLADPKTLVAAGLPDDVVKTDDLDDALSNSSLGQYAEQAAQHAADAKTGAAQSQTGAAASAASAGQAAQTGVQVAAILVSAEDAASRASLSEAAASVNASSAEQVAVGAGKALFQNIALTASALNNPEEFTVLGAWNAATNTPELTSSTGHEGDVYIVTTAGATILDGEADWSLLDGVWFHEGAWVRLDRAGYPAIARLFAAVESVIIGATTMTEASGGRTLEIADVLGNILAYIDSVGNFRTGGTSVATANFSLGTDSSWLLRIADFLGFTAFGVDETGAIKCPASAVAPDLGLLRFEVVDDGKTGVIWQDRLGFMVLDTTPPVSIISDVFTAAEIAAHDQDNKNYAARVLACGWPTGMRPTADYNIAMNLGQSEENGEMSLPLLSTAQPYDNLMLGNSVRCSDPNPTETDWQPVGTATLNPLIASAWNWQTNSPIVRPNTMENTCTPKQLTIAPDGNATVITTTDESVDFTKVVLAGESIQFSGLTGDNAQFNMAGTEVGNQTGMNGRWYYMQVSDVTAHSITVNQAMVASADVSGVTIAWYAPVEPSLGEDNLVASLNYERAQDMYRSPTRKLVGVSTAVGGQSIAQLSKGATPDLFGRNAQAVTAVRTAAGQSASVAVHVGLFGQGGSDLDAPYADYLTKFTQYVADWRNAVMDVTGQVREPFFEWFVLSGGNIQSGPNDTMGVSCAQVDAFRKNLITNGYCVGPGYWSPDYYAHWSANGERWFANMRAKVRNRVIYRGEGWQPMHIREVLWRDNVLLVKFHVPIPPIQAAKCWVGQVYKMLDDLGFTVWDNGTGEQIGIAHCDVVADTVLQITLGSVPASAPRIAYALWTNEGMGTGNLCDSDPTIAFDNYVWVEGMPFTENEPSLVGKPYPLMNWCCPYSLIATPA